MRDKWSPGPPSSLRLGEGIVFEPQERWPLRPTQDAHDHERHRKALMHPTGAVGPRQEGTAGLTQSRSSPAVRNKSREAPQCYKLWDRRQ